MFVWSIQVILKQSNCSGGSKTSCFKKSLFRTSTSPSPSLPPLDKKFGSTNPLSCNVRTLYFYGFLKLIFCDLFQKYPAPEKKNWVRNFLPQEEISCLRDEFPVTEWNFLWQEEISHHRRIFPVMGRNSLSQKETSCWRMIFSFTGQHFLSWVKIFCH